MGAAIKNYWAQKKVWIEKDFQLGDYAIFAKGLQKLTAMSICFHRVRPTMTKPLPRANLRLIKEAGISFNDLKETEADSPLGEYGCGNDFPEQPEALWKPRLNRPSLCKDELADVNFKPVRGLDGVKRSGSRCRRYKGAPCG